MDLTHRYQAQGRLGQVEEVIIGTYSANLEEEEGIQGTHALYSIR